jgi:hypothetical protein
MVLRGDWKVKGLLALLTLALALPGAAAAAGAAGSEAPRCATHLPGMPGKDLVQPLPPGLSQPPGGSPLVGPPPNPGVGDSWDWYIWSLNGPPTAQLKSCTVRGKGEHCYVVVEDTQWNVNMNQADVDAIVARFDSMSVGLWPTEGIWDLDTGTFGMPPDRLDQDPRIYILYYDLDINADGFWWVFDEYPDGTQPYHSNECEVVYLNDSDRDPGSDYMISIVAHEFEHMIHWNQDADEATWVDEGVAEYAMFLFGEPDPLGSFANNPDNDLTVWGSVFADYVQTYLYMLYLLERYGGRPTLTALVSEPANSIQGVTNTLAARGYTQTFADVFRDWILANYLDDTTVGDGRYGYVNETLPHFAGRRITTYPAGPTVTTVNHWAADYIVYLPGAPSLTASLNGSDTGQFAYYGMQMGGEYSTLVEEIPLDAAQDGSRNYPGFASWMDSLVVVVANDASTGTIGYNFSAVIDAAGAVAEGGAGDASGAAPGAGLRVFPNPLRAASGAVQVAYVLREPGSPALGVYDAEGRLVRLLRSGEEAAGSHAATWDGRDAAGRPVPSGIYWVRLAGGGGEAAAKIVVMR